MRRFPLAALAVVLAFAVGGCTSALTGPAAVVQRTLELRRSRSTDASAYAAVFAEPAVASALASDAATAKRSPIPDWERPYVSAETSASADVVVVWRGSNDHAGWAKATVFKLERRRDRWVVTDASEIPSSGAVPAAAKR